MGWRPDWYFILAFLFGTLVIAVFAWQRFHKRSFDPTDFDYHVLRELAPTQLRGPGPMRQAYMWYAGALILVYTAMTFFGGVVLSAINVIPMAGLQVSVDNAALTSAQWPLTLAFALAGFTTLIRPLEIAETWLRQQAHRWVGIPIRIKERTRTLLNSLDSEIAADHAFQVSVEKKKSFVPTWVRALAKSRDARLVDKWAELELMLNMIEDKKVWPDVTVADDLQTFVEKETQAAESALENFEDILKADYDHVPTGAKPGGEDNQEALARHRRQLETRLRAAMIQIDQSRSELGAVLSVYAERDRNYKSIDNPVIAKVLTRAFPEDTRLDTHFWIFLLLFPICVLYMFMAALGQHGLLTNVDKTPITVVMTAVLETIRIAVIFWLPLFAVLMWRQYLVEHKQWHLASATGSIRDKAVHMVAVVGLAAAVAVVGLTLLAMLWMAIIADNPTRFRVLLLGGSAPALLFFLTQAFGAIAYVFITLLAANSFEQSWSAKRALGFGILNLVVVSLIMLIHLWFWNGLGCPSDDCSYKMLYRNYNLTDFIIYAIIAFLSASLLGRAVRLGGARGTAGRKRSDPALSNIARVAVVAAMLLPFVPQREAAAEDKRPIVAGFRADAEPFSYRVGTQQDPTFKGYIADLCYDIFDGSQYSVISTEVLAENRFKRLRKATDPSYEQRPDPDKVDILCDPTTLRFNKRTIEADGIFSPVIFASGVSYILRRTRAPNADVFVAFVDNTTARKVAVRACAIDLLAIRRSGEGNAECNKVRYFCNLANSNDYEHLRGRQAGEKILQYHLCAFRTHTELIDWFCTTLKNPLRFRLAYFGDQEIIRAKLTAWKETHDCPANDIEQKEVYYTYEPYALLISKKDPGLVQFVQRRIYELFSHRSKAISLFTAAFPDVQMSPLVANLFLLNAVDEENKFNIPRLPASANAANDNENE